MLGLLLICGIIGLLVLVLKHLIDKKAYKRRIQRSDAELWSRVAEIIDRPTNTSQECHEPARAAWQTTETPQERERPPVRQHAKPELDKFLDVKRKTQVVVLDVETNGLSGESSVLSCSAIKCEIDPSTYEMNELGRFDRYYYPVEPFDPSAIAVNGLTGDAIANRRGDASYPKHFTEDPGFEQFCAGVVRFVAHNISFDAQFIPFVGRKKKLCTMITNMDIVAVAFLRRKNQWKWPTLSETASHYGISVSRSDLHSSMTDTEITAEIFGKMLHAARLG